MLKLVDGNHHCTCRKLTRCLSGNFWTWHDYVWSFGSCQVLHFFCIWQENNSVSIHQSATFHKSPRESKVFIKAWFSCNIFSRITVCDSANSYEHSQHGMLLGLVELIAISSFIWTIHNTYIQYIQEDRNLVWNNPQF